MWNRISLGVGLTLLALAWAAPAQEEGPAARFLIGASYRSFDGLDVVSTRLTNAGSNYANGSYTAADTWTVNDPDSQMVFDPFTFQYAVSFDTITTGNAGAADDLDNDLGLVLGADFPVYTDERLDFWLSFGFGYFGPNGDIRLSDGAGLTTTTRTGIMFAPGDVSGLFTTPLVSTPSAPFLDITQPIDVGGGATSSATARIEMDNDLYVLSMGATGEKATEHVAFAISLGPTINISDSNTKLYQSITDGGSATTTRSLSDKDSDIALGLYGSIGLEVYLTNQLSFGVDYRYDKVFQEVESKYAEMDLSGGSAQLRLIWTY